MLLLPLIRDVRNELEGTMYDWRKVASLALVWDLRELCSDIWPALDSCCVGGILASHCACIIQVRLHSLQLPLLCS